VSHDGISAAESGPLAGGLTSSLRRVVTGPAQIRFRWKIASETQIASLRFLVNGEERESISGTTDWSEVILDLLEGIHALRWDHAADESGSEGAPRAWLDQGPVNSGTGLQCATKEFMRPFSEKMG
jgi:hypothetical protein